MADVDFSSYEGATLPAYRYLCFNFMKHFVLWGSRLSGKSWFTISFVYFCMIYFPGLKVMLFRHETNKIRKSTFQNYKDAIKNQGIQNLVKVNNENKIELWNGSTIGYMGMKGNHLSIKDFHIHLAVYEEAEQSERKEYTAIVTNFRDGQTGKIKSMDGAFEFVNKLIMCLNPPEYEDHYINMMFEKNESDPKYYEDIEFLKTTIDDNLFATDKDYKRLEEIKFFDEHDYLRYRFGLCVARSEGLFFKERQHYWFIDKDQYKTRIALTEREIEQIAGREKASLEELKVIKLRKEVIDYQIKIYGQDFSQGTGGDPEVVLEGYVNFEHKTIIVKPCLFDNTLDTIDDEANAMEEGGVDKFNQIYADCSNKQRIRTLRAKGFNILPVGTSNPCILDTIKLLKQFKIFIYIPTEMNYFTVRNKRVKQAVKQLPLRKQIPAYSRKYDSKRECFLEDPETDKKNMGIDFWDTLRYLLYGYVKRWNKRIE